MIEKIKELLSGDVEIFGRKIPKILLVGLALIVGIFLFLKSKGSGNETYAQSQANDSSANRDSINPSTIDSGNLGNTQTDSLQPYDSTLGDSIRENGSFLDNKTFSEYQDTVAPLGDFVTDNIGYDMPMLAETQLPQTSFYDDYASSGNNTYSNDNSVVSQQSVITKEPKSLRGIALPNINTRVNQQTISQKENPLNRAINNLKNQNTQSNNQGFINRGVNNFLNQAKGNNPTTYNPFNNAMNTLAQNKGNQNQSNKPNLPPKNTSSASKQPLPPKNQNKPIVAPKMDTKTKLPPKKK